MEPKPTEPPSRPDPSRNTSLSLIEKVRRNEPDAWRRLASLYTPLVLFWCRRAGLRPSDADDTVQDVLRAAAGGIAAFRRDRPGDTFRGWLKGITRNVLLAHHRKTGREPQAEGGSDAYGRLQSLAAPDAGPDDEDDPPDELRQLYLRALDLVRGEFEAKTWDAFWRVTVDGGRPADVAAELGMSAAGVRKAKSRVLRRLKEEVGDVAE